MVRVSESTLWNRSVKNMGAVHPALKDKVRYIIHRAYIEGINVQISSGYRSNAEQTRLYNQGRSTSGNIVTNAKAGQSVHNYGLAVDYFLTNTSGSSAVWTVNRDWRRVAQIAKSLGFTWGGDWSSFKDYPHIDLSGGYGWRDLKAGKRARHLLNEGVTQEGHSGWEVFQMQLQLRKAGYDISTDALFGPGTEKALKQFQKDAGLSADGYFGPNTQKSLKNGKVVTESEGKTKEEKHMEKNIFICNAAIDAVSAYKAVVRNDGVIKFRSNAEDAKVFAEDTIYIVGGGKAGIKVGAGKVVDLSGRNAEETAQNVVKYFNLV
ncbi:M15 family metallopeptidase [Halobacillus sp. KGW1]|uniref:M15 family metallopeptidase n=1 Tax=Halobacillus sp. KGW1 TaxID=1793726 RepID=UPI000785E2FE|nr:M15 family metallopeptidase [Halobacillus sp. KGW1]